MAGNYRPVSLTCLASKLMESCVKDAMLKYLLENNLNTRVGMFLTGWFLPRYKLWSQLSQQKYLSDIKMSETWFLRRRKIITCHFV